MAIAATHAIGYRRNRATATRRLIWYVGQHWMHFESNRRAHAAVGGYRMHACQEMSRHAQRSTEVLAEARRHEEATARVTSGVLKKVQPSPEHLYSTRCGRWRPPQRVEGKYAQGLQCSKPAASVSLMLAGKSAALLNCCLADNLATQGCLSQRDLPDDLNMLFRHSNLLDNLAR
jgi:hypothetical protein